MSNKLQERIAGLEKLVGACAKQKNERDERIVELEDEIAYRQEEKENNVAAWEDEIMPLREAIQDVIWKLEHFHEFEQPERNAFLENMPMHLKALLVEENEQA